MTLRPADVEAYTERAAILAADDVPDPDATAARMVWPDCEDAAARAREAEQVWALRWTRVVARPA